MASADLAHRFVRIDGVECDISAGCGARQEPMWKLVIKDDEGRQIVVPLKQDEYVLGRKAGSRIRLVERNVSRQHAKLCKHSDPSGNTPDSFTIEDLASSNGTHVNGAKLGALKSLVHGDLIQIGDYRIVLQDDMAGEVTPRPMVTGAPEYDPD